MMMINNKNPYMKFKIINSNSNNKTKNSNNLNNNKNIMLKNLEKVNNF